MPRDRERSRDRKRSRDRERDKDRGRDKDQKADTRDWCTRGREPERGSGSGRITGICKVWMENRGMGFISPENGGQDYFVHRSQLLDGQSLAVGIEVTFDATIDPMKNKPIAKNCRRTVSLAIAVDPNNPEGAQVAVEGTQTGTVSAWREDNGIGFITPDSGGGLDFFVHRTALLDGGSLVVGAKVAFEPGWDANKKKPVAVRVSGAASQISPVGGPTGPNAHLYPAHAAPEYQNFDGTLSAASSSVQQQQLSQLADISALYGAAAVGGYDAATLAALAGFGGTSADVLSMLASAGALPSIGNAPAANPTTEISAPAVNPALATALAGLATGHVVEWSEHRGMGFIRAAHGKGADGDVFVHRSSLQDVQSLTVGQTVLYEPGKDAKKGPCTKLCYVKCGQGVVGAQSVGAQSVGAQFVGAQSVGAQSVGSTASACAFIPGTIVTWNEEQGMGVIRCSQGGGDVVVQRSAMQDTETIAEGAPCFYLPYWDPEKKQPCTKLCFMKGLPADGGAAALARVAAEETQQALAAYAPSPVDDACDSSSLSQWPFVTTPGNPAGWKTLACLCESLNIKQVKFEYF